ncbi:DUF1328 domain-containing protein [Palleronia caenipelagi]|uniref:DUF1328 domain-containing protein n=1 Tax=Palleronia caenipelagi TaxID=2489174 RepID=A0A547Q5L9_9RHOB|nr:DUF1328 domain-containing protein [Palleronia caenipelagi]TRD21686.1 DUF1328 domain-containing protein [Palleronia caenipelagi]
MVRSVIFLVIATLIGLWGFGGGETVHANAARIVFLVLLAIAVIQPLVRLSRRDGPERP